MKRLFTIVCCLRIITATGYAQPDASAQWLHRAQQALTDVIVHDIFSPPVASRIYVYAHIAAHEALTAGTQGSLHRAIQGMPLLPRANRTDLPIAAIHAFLRTGAALVFSEKRLDDSLQVMLDEMRRSVDKKVYDRSLAYGKRVSDSILAWASTDSYRETRSMRRYSHGKTGSVWIPTPPAYMAAVEPYWSMIRPMIIDSAAAFRPPAPIPFSTDSASDFFGQAREVYLTGMQLSAGQRDIALFWDCNPFFVNTSGHLMFASKKLSPGGHWLSIAGLAARSRKLSLLNTSEAYLYTALALYDGFISCWEEKFRSNYIRPETFINAHIDESWRPLLQTPPFPEYTSGHSVISTAAAVVLTALLGEHFGFSDSTETAYGLPVRRFDSFEAAAQEASVSRLYGGIHFREAIANGQVQGKRIGEDIVKKIYIRPLLPTR